MEKIVLTDTQALVVRNAIRAGNPTFSLYLLDRRTARSLYAKGLTDSDIFGAHLNEAGKDVAHQLKTRPQRRTFHIEPPAKVVYRLQPADRPDGIHSDGTPMYQQPWPVVARPDGSVVGADDHWCGEVVQVIGFQAKPTVHSIDLNWSGFLLDPQQAVRMYLVTSDKNGNWRSFDTAVESVTEVAVENPERI